MKNNNKLKYIQDNHFNEWLKTRQEVENELSEEQLMFCICGRLATGLHEGICRKFADKVNKETLKRLEYLLKEQS
jgi:fructose-1-phosphate kinase PfkB-like protein